MKIKGATLTCLLLVVLFNLLHGQEQEISKLQRRATDLTGTLRSSELQALEAKLRDFERATSTQLVVLMVSTTGALPIEDASLSVAQANGIGQKGGNNGVLLYIAKNDRQLRIEVGYGLEGALPDALAGQIIRKEIVPHFRNGDYYGGINAGIDAILKATRNEYKAERNKVKSPSDVVAPLVLILFIVFLLLKRGLGGYRRSMFGRMGPTYYSGWGGGRSSGGGGFDGGGFSSGGGSFGGGGASGRW